MVKRWSISLSPEIFILAMLIGIKITIKTYYFCQLMLVFLFTKIIMKLLQLKPGWGVPNFQRQALLKVCLL
jgi:hypothetical protein